MFSLFLALVGLLPIIVASPLPAEYRRTMTSDENHGNRLVFCHFMVSGLFRTVFVSILIFF